MAAYYNEHDQFAAAWLRALIKAGLIADGEVDERSIEDVSADDVRGFVQCHWFAGIGGWSYALRLAGWADDRAVWTGSCPCQPFSAAGKAAGADDSRDLWPTWFGLIRECRPLVCFGEQVASADGLGWFDRVSADMETENYAIAAADLCAPSVGAFHVRQRLWFVADTDERHAIDGALQRGGQHGLRAEDRRADGDARELEQPETRVANTTRGRQREHRCASGRPGHSNECESAGQLGESDEQQRSERRVGDTGGYDHIEAERCAEGRDSRSSSDAGGFWSNCDWIDCADGKARPVEPGTFPLAHGVSARVGRLRGYGNAIVPQVAQVFIESYLDAIT